MLERIVGVFKLNPATFEEVEHDETATGQAAIVVLVVAILGGIGSLATSSYMGGGSATGGLISSIVSSFLSWLVWSFLTYFIGTRLFGGQATMGEMLRVIGFAYAPMVLGIIPCVGPLVGLVWTLAAAFVGIRQGLDVSNGKTALTILVGLLVYVGISLILAMLLGGTAMIGDVMEGFTA